MGPCQSMCASSDSALLDSSGVTIVSNEGTKAASGGGGGFFKSPDQKHDGKLKGVIIDERILVEKQGLRELRDVLDRLVGGFDKFAKKNLAMVQPDIVRASGRLHCIVFERCRV